MGGRIGAQLCKQKEKKATCNYYYYYLGIDCFVLSLSFFFFLFFVYVQDCGSERRRKKDNLQNPRDTLQQIAILFFFGLRNCHDQEII